MCLRNSIIFDKGGKIKFDTSGSIQLAIGNIKTIQRYACPVRLQDVENYTFENGRLTVDKPGRYLIEYD